MASGVVDVTSDRRTAERDVVKTDRRDRGGNVRIFGDRINLTNLDINASGRTGGGTIHIGGGVQGAASSPQAAQTVISPSVSLSANARDDGNGGEIVVWANEVTEYWGSASARGGPNGGNGGFVEISGKEQLIFRGEVDVSASAGSTGFLLLDPRNIRIINGTGGTDDAQLTNGSAGSASNQQSYTISEAALEGLSGKTNLQLQATNNIVFEDLSDGELTFASGTGSITLTADADQDGGGNIVMLDTSDRLSASGRSIELSGANFILGDISTTSSRSGGDITLRASETVSARNLDAHSDKATGGDISIYANGDIKASVLSTEGSSGSGDITIISNTGSITTGDLLTEATSGERGNIVLSTPAELTTGDITASGLMLNNVETHGLDSKVEERRPGSQSSSNRQRSSSSNQSSRRLLRNERATRPNRRSNRRRQQISIRRIAMNSATADIAVEELEQQRIEEFSDYFGRDLEAKTVTSAEVQQLLTNMQAQTQHQSAVIYVNAPSQADKVAGGDRPMELTLFTATAEPIRLEVSEVTQEQLLQTIAEFRTTLLTSASRGTTSYLESSQTLYQWLIQPIEDELGAGAVDTLLFSMDVGLRSLPIAALHDGEQFVVEKYSVGMVPSLGLMSTQYRPLEDAQVLAMGASTFESLQPLPAVPTEISAISQLWPSQSFLNESFTRQNLVEQQQQRPSQIVHLATHAELNPGSADNSYIQLWNERLLLSDIHRLGWDNPAVDLLVLSACQTALGNPEAEMGFAGLAIASGVNSVTASLWSVSDVGTLALMGEFYDQLRNSAVKSEALQNAQLAMLNGDVRIESGQLLSNSIRSAVSLPLELRDTQALNLSHPYYWSGFTMVGSPW